MTLDRAVVSSPATIANFGPGFDSFGLCLESPRDTISIRRLGGSERVVKVAGKHALPMNPDENTASYSATKLAQMFGSGNLGFSMTIRKGTKPGSGLGSSAASSVGGALAMASILGVKDKRMMLEAAAMGEELVSGTRHFDNVAAALFGGFTVVSDIETRTVIWVRPPPFRIAVALPEISVETRKARALLPPTVRLGDAVCNVGWASGMMHAMMKRDVKLIGRYLDDRLALPYRKDLIPGYERVREAAVAAGALGVSIGGSGPAVFAVSEGNATRIRAAMVREFEKVGLRSESFVTIPGNGARLESLG